LGSRSG
jgi:hypothetical protein